MKELLEKLDTEIRKEEQRKIHVNLDNLYADELHWEYIKGLRKARALAEQCMQEEHNDRNSR
jgi:hypothetical protein